MAAIDNKQALKSVRQRKYLARDFDGFRRVILDYAKQYYPDKIQDFSEASLGGLLLDMAAYVGDNLSFYLDHMYGELNFDTVVETKNIERTVTNAGIKIVGAAPSSVDIDFFIEVPVISTTKLEPDPAALPTISANAVLQSDNNINFTLVDDLNFWKLNLETRRLELSSDVEVTNGRRSSGTIISKILKKTAICISGSETVDTFDIGVFKQFRTITLSQSNVSQIISVTDDFGNIYYEVDNLSHDVVYKNTLNTSLNDSLVKDSLKVIPAPYRYVANTSLTDKKITLTFGGGTADSLDDDAIPDPSEFAIPLRYSQTFSRRAINPQRLLQTSTLGVAASSTRLTIRYRYGGGLNHNVAPGSIKSVASVSFIFPSNPPYQVRDQVSSGLEVFNSRQASGGEDAPTGEELLALVPAIKSAQERIVTKQDLLARVYTMPSNFGRIFRASVSNNPNNPLASRLHVISRSPVGSLIISSDALKINLKRYLSSYRMISDAIDILDAEVINYEVFFKVVIDPSFNKTTLLRSIIQSLQAQLEIRNFHINQPIVKSELINTIYSQAGVIAVDRLTINNLYGTVLNRTYSSSTYDVPTNTRNQIIYPPNGGIFELRYPDVNITGRAVSNV